MGWYIWPDGEVKQYDCSICHKPIQVGEKVYFVGRAKDNGPTGVDHALCTWEDVEKHEAQKR